MRNPALWRDVSLAATAAGLAAVVAAVRVPAFGEGALHFVLLFGGMLAMPIGIVTGIMAWAVVRTERALRSGEGVMGRWRIDPAVWPAFLALEAKLAAAPGAPINEFTLPKGAPKRSLEVIVGKEGVIVGDTVVRMPLHSHPEITVAGLRMEPGTPVCIELGLYYPPVATRSGSTEPLHTVLRFPVAPTAEREAAQFVTYYHHGRLGDASFFHGPGDGSDPEDLSACRSCGWQTHRLVSACARCGGPMISRRWARRFGGVLVVIGVALTIGLAYLLWNLSPQLLHPGRSVGGSRFGGTPVQALGVFMVLCSVLVFGAMTLVYGAWSMRTGRRNLTFALRMLGVTGAVFVLGMAALVLGKYV